MEKEKFPELVTKITEKNYFLNSLLFLQRITQIPETPE
jgi:hypothetical protein